MMFVHRCQDCGHIDLGGTQEFRGDERLPSEPVFPRARCGYTAETCHPDRGCTWGPPEAMKTWGPTFKVEEFYHRPGHLFASGLYACGCPQCREAYAAATGEAAS